MCNLFLFLFALFCFSSVHSLKEIAVRENRKECEKMYSRLDFCATDYNFCIEKESPESVCSQKYQKCKEESLYDEEGCLLIDRNRLTQSPSFIKKWKEDVRKITEKARKDCEIERIQESSGSDFQQGLLYIKALKQTVQTEKCLDVKVSVDEELIAKDEKTSKELPIPFNRFYCGWQFGYVGKIFFREIISLSCGHESIKINHCCAEQLSCYVEGNDEKNICDQRFVDCFKNNVDRMKSYKNTCDELLKEVNKTLSILQNVEMKLSATNSTKLDVFNGVFEKGMSIFDTLQIDTLQFTIFKLSYNNYLDSEIRDKFNEDVLKEGWSKRMIIDSCALIFEESLRHNKLDPSLQKFVVCLNNIENKTEEFDHVVEEFGREVTSYFAQRVTMSAIKKMVKEQIDEFHSAIVQEYILFCVLMAILNFVWFFIKDDVEKKWNEYTCFTRTLPPSSSNCDATDPLVNSTTSPLITSPTEQTISYDAQTDEVSIRRE